MDSLWRDDAAARFPGPLGPRVYASRLLGGDPALVLFGGGNTSVKVRESPGPGATQALFVKGSGTDLARVEADDFTPINLAAARRLLDGAPLTNAAMYEALATMVLRPGAPKPSIETLLHAALPFAYVDHAHADSVLALANCARSDEVIDAVYGELAPAVPYRHSGFSLARACRDVYARRGTGRTIGLILQFHGVVAFGESARASYENLLRLVTLAEDYLKARGAWTLSCAANPGGDAVPLAVADLRAEISRAAGFPLILRVDRSPVALAFCRRPDLHEVSQQGPATPQHAIFTRRVPLIGRDVARFVANYRSYLNAALPPADAAALDASPRVVVDPQLGVCALGVSASHAAMAAEVYRHDIEIISRAAAHDAYRSAPPAAIAEAELEYGGFETAFRRTAAQARPFAGHVAVICPAAARRDPTLAARLLASGCAVASSSPAPPDAASAQSWLALDTGMPAQRALALTVATFGGVDHLYAADDEESWREAFAPVLARSPVASATEDAAP
ncbi:MAG TPA: class II aldolase/adducin family protein [Pelomicrobium sp.]|nr:class II aldolase/adducin family protein [Pelomicrobium sp.]